MSLRAEAIAQIPSGLQDIPQWVVWNGETRGEEWTKLPYQITKPKALASVSDASTWTTFQRAAEAAAGDGFSGVGIVLTKEWRLLVVDFDHCRNRETGAIDVEIWAKVERLDSYTEVSPSGGGLHVFVWAEKPGPRCKWSKDGDEIRIEIYSADRFITVTGEHLKGTPTEVMGRQREANALYTELFPEKPSGNGATAPAAGPTLEEIVAKIGGSPDGETFRALIAGDISRFGGDDSKADFALCRIISQFTRSPAAIDAIFRSSKLYRDKWEREDYRERTIRAAVEGARGSGSAGVADDPSRFLVLTPVDTLDLEACSWLDEEHPNGRIPLGELFLIAGREGVGKSLWWAKLAAEVTRGTLSGEYAGIPKGVIVCASEDSWTKTLYPRLKAAGADCSRVYRVEVESSLPDETGVNLMNLPQDIKRLERSIVEYDIALVVVDPLLSRLDPDLDTHRDGDVRKALEPLSLMAHRSGCSIGGLIHVNKSGSTDPLTTIMGSRAFVGVSRAVIYMQKDRDDPGTRLASNPRNNLGIENLPTRCHRIENVQVGIDKRTLKSVFTAKLVLVGERDISARELLERDAEVPEFSHHKTDDAGDWLVEFLEGQPGRSAPGDVVEAKGRGQQYNIRLLRRAADRRGVVMERTELGSSQGGGRPSTWRLP